MLPGVPSTVIHPGDPGYPPLLASVSSPPVLHVRGRLLTEDALAVAIVGARRASPYGLAAAERLGAGLAAAGITVVSGLARGVDGAAHRGALEAGGRTVAVLGSGIDVVYPPEHRRLAEAIASQGAVVSQFAPGTRPLAGHFPARNRTIAGLTLGVVVVEASERSGALITATWAAELGREVFALPGPVTAEGSQGPHRLIREGARLIRDWADVVDDLPEPWRRAVRQPPATPGGDGPEWPSGDEGLVLAVLRQDEPRHIEQVIEAAGLDPGRVAAALLGLELGGRARALEGQRWVARPDGPRRTEWPRSRW